MFDWNDEELDNIIWGEAGVSDDHIVPFPKGNDGKPQLVSGDQNRKECQQEFTQPKPWQNTSEVKIGSHSSQSATASIFGANDKHSTSGFCMVSWPDFSSSNVAKTDQDMHIEFNNLKEVTKPDSLREDKASLESHTGILQNRHEDKADGDFEDYGWANIGSFDDIDRFFSSDDPIFGNASLDNAGELWTSSKKIGNSLPSSVDPPSLALGVSNTALRHIEIKAEYGQYEYLPLTAGGSKWSDLKSHDLQNQHGFMDGHATAKSKPVLKNQETLDTLEKATTATSLVTSDTASTLNKLSDKVNKRKILKYRKNIAERGKMLQGPYSSSTWSQPRSQFERSDILPSCLSSVLPQKRPHHGPKSLQYQHISSPHVPPATYGNPVNQYSATPLLSNLHSEVLLGTTNHMDKTVDVCMKRFTMTPQEKIEKLRRRQQMQALLAIQKQQQQINNMIPSASSSFKENQNHLSEGADVKVEECLSKLPSLDPNLPNEQDISDIVSITTDNNSLEVTILSQLQNVVSKLDMKERLCIRDSLFRLAQSSMERHYTNDSSKRDMTIREENQFAAKEVKIHHGYATMCDLEAETNHSDRTIAHLLFHRHSEMEGTQHGTPESPISTISSLFSSSENIGSFIGTKYPCPMIKPQDGGDQYITSPCMDTSHNASNDDGSYGEASK